MRRRARVRLSGAVALVAASGLGGGAALAQTGAISPLVAKLPSQRVLVADPGVGGGSSGVGSATGQNAGTVLAAGGTAAASNLPPGTVLPGPKQNAGTAPAPSGAGAAGATPPSPE
ncbi:MAG TPA: hypothetical protein VJ779_02655, partial [Acetobacteraceae bacterium]|nr:hypothetical protein [Acetobacteraceae bacterium]